MSRKKFKMVWEPESQAYRIYALRSFNDVVEGEAGGLISEEINLSHYGNCWVYQGSKVTGHSCISHNAEIRGESYIENSVISGEVVISDTSVKGSTVKGGSVIMSGLIDGCKISGSIKLSGIDLHNAELKGTSLKKESIINVNKSVTDLITIL